MVKQRSCVGELGNVIGAGLLEILEGTPDAVFVLQDEVIIYANTAGRTFCLGAAVASSIEGATFPDVVVIEDADGLPIHYKELRKNLHTFKLESSVRSRAHCWERSLVLCSERAGHDVVLIRDCSQKERATRMLRWLGRHDVLTSMLNRDGLVEGVEGLHGAYLLCVNIDYFRVLNDAIGHEAADQALVMAASVIRRVVGALDLVARDGGDEFLVVLAEADETRAIAVAQQIEKEIAAERLEILGAAFQITVSIGVARMNRCDRKGIQEARTRANYAACNAKLRERSVCAEWSGSMESDLESELALAILNGLAPNRLDLFRQRIESTVGKPSGFEILARCYGKAGEHICAERLFSIAERYGLAIKLDRLIVNLAIENYAGLVAGGAYLNVNVSVQSTKSLEFAKWIVKRFREAGIPEGALRIEVTETARVDSVVETRAFIETLQQGGLPVALDDFGSGAAGFSLLRELPVDFVKLDGRFMTDVDNSPAAQEVARSIVSLAKVFGFELVAEWIETNSAREWSQKNGIQAVQGFFVGRPEMMLSYRNGVIL